MTEVRIDRFTRRPISLITVRIRFHVKQSKTSIASRIINARHIGVSTVMPPLPSFITASGSSSCYDATAVRDLLTSEVAGQRTVPGGQRESISLFVSICLHPVSELPKFNKYRRYSITATIVGRELHATNDQSSLH